MRVRVRFDGETTTNFSGRHALGSPFVEVDTSAWGPNHIAETMSVLAEVLVPASEFVLADTLTAVPSIRIEIKRVVASTDNVTPYFWAFGEDIDEFEQALRDDPGIQDMLTLEDQQDAERFYRVTWLNDAPNLLTAVSEAKAAILEAVSDDGGAWQLKLLFPDRESLTRFHDYCLENDFSFRLQRVYQPENPEEQGEYDVTPEQQEALEVAYHAGYFDVPRDITLTDLADELDISRNALSARIRRGERNLLSNTLIHEENG